MSHGTSEILIHVLVTNTYDNKVFLHIGNFTLLLIYHWSRNMFSNASIIFLRTVNHK